MKGEKTIMIIEYEKCNFSKEQCNIEIKDLKNVFLKGKNPFDNLDTYFGIWVNNKPVSYTHLRAHET